MWSPKATTKAHCPMNRTCLRKLLVYYKRITKSNYTKKVVEQVLRSTTLIIKNNLMINSVKMNPSHELNIEQTKIKSQIPWKIKGIHKPCKQVSKHCNLHITEKLEILDETDKKLSQKRSKIIRHQNDNK